MRSRMEILRSVRLANGRQRSRSWAAVERESTLQDDSDEPFLFLCRETVGEGRQDLVLPAATNIRRPFPCGLGAHALSGSSSKLVELRVDLIDGQFAPGPNGPLGNDVVSDLCEVACTFLFGTGLSGPNRRELRYRQVRTSLLSGAFQDSSFFAADVEGARPSAAM